MELFYLNQQDDEIKLAIRKTIKSVIRNETNKRVTVTLQSNHVDFYFAQFEFDDHYIAMSSISSILKLFLRRQFDQNSKGMRVKLTDNVGDEVTLVFKKIKFKQGGFLGLRLSTEGTFGGAELSMNMASISSFSDALSKAMNWASPVPVWDSETEMINRR